MKRSELTDFSVEEEGFKLKIRRAGNELPVVSTSSGTQPPFAPAMPVAAAPAAPAAPPALAGDDEAGVTYIKSPMVGTFYKSASPESAAYVEPGAKVTETSVVCIIEAMKIMNEIQAEAKGTIVETLVENGAPVEYGQRLFKIKAA